MWVEGTCTMVFCLVTRMDLLQHYRHLCGMQPSARCRALASVDQSPVRRPRALTPPRRGYVGLNFRRGSEELSFSIIRNNLHSATSQKTVIFILAERNGNLTSIWEMSQWNNVSSSSNQGLTFSLFSIHYRMIGYVIHYSPAARSNHSPSCGLQWRYL
jgi:hypothetical protein